MKPRSTGRDQVRSECWTHAIYCFGTSFVFEKRVRRLRNRVQLLAFLGLASPISVGTAVLLHGLHSAVAKVLAPIAALASMVQVIASLYALVRGWSDHLVYALESTSGNRELYEDFRRLGAFPPDEDQELQRRFDVLLARDAARTKQDDKYPLTDEEKRIGMRAGLRQVGRKCAGCNLVPTSMTASECGVCGNFKIRRI